MDKRNYQTSKGIERVENFLNELYTRTGEPLVVSLRVSSEGIKFESCITKKRLKEIETEEGDDEERPIEEKKKIEDLNLSSPLLQKKEVMEYIG